MSADPDYQNAMRQSTKIHARCSNCGASISEYLTAEELLRGHLRVTGTLCDDCLLAGETR